MSKKIKILLTGGGTGGSVTPLLALAQSLKASGDDYDFLWIGTTAGPEREMVIQEEIDFKAIQSGKLRRYFSLKNVTDIARIFVGLWQSWVIIRKYQPDLIIGAGSFVCLPPAVVGYFCHIPVIAHQQDVRQGLANRLIKPFAKAVTVSLEQSLGDYGVKAVWIGNPVRQEFAAVLKNKKLADSFIEKYNLKNDLPLVLIFGGGTGASKINALVVDSLKELTKFSQVLHLTGRGKAQDIKNKNYLALDFLDALDMAAAMAAASLIVSRCGMGALTEISFLGKPAILIPMPDSHQEDNAEVFAAKEAAIILAQKEINADNFVKLIKKLLANQNKLDELSRNIKQVMPADANSKLVAEIKKIFGK